MVIKISNSRNVRQKQTHKKIMLTKMNKINFPSIYMHQTTTLYVSVAEYGILIPQMHRNLKMGFSDIPAYLLF